LHTYPDAVYYCSQDIADALCSRSRDGGVTFGAAVPIYNLLDCGGLHGHVVVAPDGTVYVPNKGCGGSQAVAVSEDNGLTWSVRKVPGSTPGDTDPSVGIGANGTIYFGYQNSDGHPRIAVSHDKGLTWENDQDVGTTFGLQNVVFPAVVAGDDDRAAFSYLGTPTGGNYQATSFTGLWHTYVSTTYDGGRSWVTTDTTPTDPVQKGSICTAGTTCGQNRNLLDFIGITVDAQGRPLVGYADGCTGACATGGPQNFDALATIARQSSGLRLFAAFDPAPDLTVTALTVSSPTRGAVRSRVTVANVGTATATGAVVATTVDGAQAVSSAPVTLAPGQSTTVILNSPGKATRGSHTVLATADPTNAVRESDETNNKKSSTVTVK
ncbi:MAG: hypothetical protein H0T85_11985, partial [Geodermatophilaceae bacterium]|nr:hypothetical protein [Geodermatophilaceae bacterium]